jgi:hypothetical protein
MLVVNCQIVIKLAILVKITKTRRWEFHFLIDNSIFYGIRFLKFPRQVGLIFL